jgi:hypothetical protein
MGRFPKSDICSRGSTSANSALFDEVEPKEASQEVSREGCFASGFVITSPALLFLCSAEEGIV